MREAGERDVRIVVGKTFEGRPGATVSAPYRRKFVERIKRKVPSEDRAWWPDHLRWWVAEEYVEETIELVRKLYGETIVVDENGDETYHERDGTVSARQERLF